MIFKPIDPIEDIKMDYTNWRGVREVRHITPICIEWGSNQWHTEPQWLMLAWCHRSKTKKCFALKSIHEWGTMK